MFLDVQPGMTVTVRCDCLTAERQGKDWWMGQVVHCGGAARDTSIHNLFKVADMGSEPFTRSSPEPRCLCTRAVQGVSPEGL